MLSQANQVHVLPLDLFKIHFNILIPTKLSFTKLSLSVRFPTEILYAYISLLQGKTVPVHALKEYRGTEV